MNNGATLEKVRTIVFTSLLISNVFLTFVNRSVTQTIKYTIHYKNKLAPFIIIISVMFLAAILTFPFLRNLFQLTTITVGELALCTGVALAGVMWFEVYKATLRTKSGEDTGKV